MTSQDIDDALTETEPVQYTQRRHTLIGSFNISRAQIPFFLSSIALKDAVGLLDLVENLPADLRSHWKLEELFQREISWDRVEDEIVDGYLRRPEKLQFFNALTVAMLPISTEKRLLNSYVEDHDRPPVPTKFSNAPWQVLNIGGVELIRASNSNVGYISWNPRTIFPATIDGQHRLAALKTLVNKGALTSTQESSSISVIFLVLDPRVGFKLDERQIQNDENPLLTVVREIFIDLNKSARPVVRAREIILNDQEIESRCVRLLLAQRVGEDSVDRIPLGLVHWQHNVTAKFNAGDHTGPFITTVELLHLIVSDILDIKRPKNPFDKDEVASFVRSVEDGLGLSAWIGAHPERYNNDEMPSLETYIERNHVRTGWDTPFANLPPQYLKAADEAFQANWAPLFLATFRRFAPYERFASEVRARGGIDGELAQFLVLPTRSKKIQQDTWGREETYEKIFKRLRELHQSKQEDWAFYAVFQKALFRASADCWRHADVVMKGKPTLAEFTDAWLAFLNDLDARGLLKVRAQLGETGLIWLGIALNSGSKTVKWNESSALRIAGLLRLWWYASATRSRRVGPFFKALKAPRANERFPDAAKLLTQLQNSLKGVVAGPEEELDPSVLEKRLNERLKDLLLVGLPTTSQGDEGDAEGIDAEAGDGDDDKGAPEQSPA